MSTVEVTKQIKSVRLAATKLQALVNELSPIETDTQLYDATVLLSAVTKASKELDTKKKSILVPLRASIKEVNSLFLPEEDRLDKAKQHVKDAILAYHERVAAEAQKKAEYIERRLEKGTMRTDTAMIKLASVETPKTIVQTLDGSAQIRQGREKVRITNVYNLVAARPDLLEDSRVQEALRIAVSFDYKLRGTLPEGVEVYREKVVAGVTL